MPNDAPPSTDPMEVIRFMLEAGVDTPMLEMPVNRLAEAEKPAAAPAVLQRQDPAPKPGPARQTISATPSTDHIRIAAAAETLQELRAALETNDICPLKKTATQLVFADGNPQARVMLVGEAPGRDEDLAGRPFVGRSGQLLDRMLAAIGLDRTQLYIANTVPWRPPGNRQPTAEETAQCLPFIRRQIGLVGPDILVLVGGQSTRALLGAPEGIMQMRGRWTTVDLGGGLRIPALPMVHPAYLLRNPPHKKLAWADMLSLRRGIAALPPRG
jgi:DNA polymerase